MAEKMIASRVNMDGRIYAVFDGRGEPGSLGACCLSLLSEQKAEWPMLRQGYESLARVRVKEVACNGFRVRVQHNPGRITSTLAHVGKEEVRARPCFLCAANLPEGQKAVLYRDRYLILPNPMPVFPAHFTVCHRDHRLQAVKGEILTLLGLAEDFGEEWAILYNGPRCGASAPDHLHFQAVPSGMMPVEGEMDANGALATVLISGNTVLRRMAGAGREVLVLDGADATDLAFIFNKLVAALAGGANEEPMMSIIGLRKRGTFRLVVFPRAKHRPDAFFREGEERLAVSPAVVEMGGVMVTPMERDFERLDGHEAEAVLREVSLGKDMVDRAIRSLARQA